MYTLKRLRLNNGSLALYPALLVLSLALAKKIVVLWNLKVRQMINTEGKYTPKIAIPKRLPHLKLSQMTMVDGKPVDGEWVFTAATV